MTDRDVVERVAQQFGTAVMAIDKGKYRTEFAATLKGERAVAFMADIRPWMGTRRQHAIDSAVSCYRPPARKLNFEIAEEIRRRASTGGSVASLAIEYEVARQTIYPILRGEIYRAPPSRPWRNSSLELRLDTPNGKPEEPADHYRAQIVKPKNSSGLHRWRRPESNRRGWP